MRKVFKKLALALGLVLVLSMAVALPAFASADPAISAVITKNMQMPAGVTAPAGGLTFEFTFEARGFDGGDSNSGLNHPVLAPVTIEIPANAVDGAIQTRNIHAALVTAANLAGVNAGPHDWIVRETIGSADGVTYDTTQYILRAHITNPVAPATERAVPNVEIYAFNATTGAIGDKQGAGMQFTNVFAPEVTGTATNPALLVSKTIGDTNRQNANLNTLFPFTVTLQAPPALGEVVPVLPGTTPGNFTATIVLANGDPAPTVIGTTPRPTTVNFVAGEGNFSLRDGERLNIISLPAGATYTVLETGTDQFRANATVIQAGIATLTSPYGPSTGAYGVDLSVNGVVQNAGTVPNNSAAFTNTMQTITLAGLATNNLPIVALAIAAIVATLVLVTRSRRRVEETPVV